MQAGMYGGREEGRGSRCVTLMMLVDTALPVYMSIRNDVCESGMVCVNLV